MIIGKALASSPRASILAIFKFVSKRKRGVLPISESVVLTEEGAERSERLFRELFCVR